MNHAPRLSRVAASAKRATNVSLNAELITEAKALGVNISQACEAGLAARIRQERGEKWKEDNREAIESWNVYLRDNGMPYDEYRQF